MTTTTPPPGRADPSQAISPRGQVDLKSPAALGETWRILESGVNIKQYPMCYGAHRVVDATIDYKVSSGLEDQGIRDWYQHAQEKMASEDPDAVVFIIGTNDASIANTYDGNNDGIGDFRGLTERLDYLGRDGNPRTARRLHALNLGPRLGVVARVTDRTAVRSGYALVWIEQAGITTPFTQPQFPFLQNVGQRSLDAIRPAEERDPRGVAEARGLLDTVYRWLDDTLTGRVWAAGGAFSLADCAAAPFLFYADWTVEIGPQHPNVKAYRARLLARPKALMP